MAVTASKRKHGFGKVETFPNPFLVTKYTEQDAKRFEVEAASWNVLMNHIYDMTELDLVKLFIWETEGKRRIHMLNRVKSRHNRMRDQRERQEIFDVGI